MKFLRVFGLAGVAAAAIAVVVTGSAAEAASTNAHSTAFAGYAAGVAGAVTVSTNFKVEAITCAATHEGMAPGIVLLNTATSVVTSGSIFESCLTGKPAYWAVATVNNVTSALPIPVAAGHKISITVAVSSTASTVQIADVTTHIAKSASGTGGAPNALNVGVNPLSSGTLLDVPQFLKQRFNGTKINGAPLSVSKPTATDRVTSGGVMQVRTGALSSTGVDFTETFKHH